MSNKDLTGLKIDKVTVIKRANVNNKGDRWLCLCDCGNYVIFSELSLTRKSENKRSCGCEWKENWKKCFETHGCTKTRLYRIWQGMKKRCCTKTCSNYKYYGAKGIKVCDDWLTFTTFREWAINNGYNDTLSIDRINSNGNYEPSNCRWVKQNTQVRNRSMSRMVTWNGKTQLIKDWAEELGVTYETLRVRINKWGVEKAFTTPFPSRLS